MTSILIVEDEVDLAEVVADYARAAGHAPEVCADGAQALARLRTQPFDLLVLDLMLPGLDGLSVCKAVRTFSNLPIIMVTAKVEEIDRLLGLDAGADDYVCKPFSPRELMARVKAIIRRTQPSVRPSLVQFDDASRTVRVASTALNLTPTEYAVFAALAKRPGTIFTRAQLLDLARGDSLEITDRVIDSHIKNLRRKLAAAMPDTELIHSVYGVGYRFEFD